MNLLILKYTLLLVGHSLDSDLRGLRLIHNKVIDTVALYPNVRGAPFKISLKTLATEVLGLSIQDAGAAGHDSIQDAAVALELALHYLGNTSAVGGYVSPLDIAWSTGDNFAAPRCSLIQHPSLQQLQKELHISTYLCGPYIDRPQFERFLIGYRLEADPSAAFNQIDDSFVKVYKKKLYIVRVLFTFFSLLISRRTFTSSMIRRKQFLQHYIILIIAP